MTSPAPWTVTSSSSLTLSSASRGALHDDARGPGAQVEEMGVAAPWIVAVRWSTVPLASRSPGALELELELLGVEIR